MTDARGRERKAAAAGTGVSGALASRAEEYADRLTRLRAVLEARHLDVVLVSDVHDVRYLSAFRGEDAVLIVGPEMALIATDSRNWGQVEEEVVGFTLERTTKLPDDALAAAGREWGGDAALGFQGTDVSHSTWRVMRRLHGGRLRDVGDSVSRLRIVKQPSELAELRRAAQVIESALETALAPGIVGSSEGELAWRIEVAMREAGAEAPAFDTIVAAGPRGALAHAIPGERRIEAGELVVVDCGARCNGYNSDITRTFATGELDGEVQAAYEVVLAAQLAGLAAVRPGVSGRQVDAAARAVIEQAGLGDRFGHGTGHGVGLQIHELPRLGRTVGDQLAEGMVHTVEPGVYVDGRFGVRIEDTVAVTADGCERLTRSAKELRVVD